MRLKTKLLLFLAGLGSLTLLSVPTWIFIGLINLLGHISSFFAYFLLMSALLPVFCVSLVVFDLLVVVVYVVLFISSIEE